MAGFCLLFHLRTQAELALAVVILQKKTAELRLILNVLTVVIKTMPMRLVQSIY